MSSKQESLTLPIDIKGSLNQYWICFEGLYLNDEQHRLRVALKIQSPFQTQESLDTFAWQKYLQKFHNISFSSQEEYLQVLQDALPTSISIKVASSSDLTLNFEQLEPKTVLENLRFICAQSKQPFYGHIRTEKEVDLQSFRWALLQIRSQHLLPHQVADKVRDILQDDTTELSWALSRRGGISYQASTINTIYKRSGIE